jgi:hypothetical protein
MTVLGALADQRLTKAGCAEPNAGISELCSHLGGQAQSPIHFREDQPGMVCADLRDVMSSLSHFPDGLTRNFRGRRVLEAGAGQSTLWWASRGAQVVALEGDQKWLDSLQRQVPGNVSLRLVALADVEACLQSVTEAIKDEPPFDVIIIDGLYRSEVLSILADRLAPNGIIICDDSEGYGFFNVLSRDELLLQRVDFYGYAPGVIEKHCTSIAFRESAFVFAPNIPVHEPPLWKPDPTRRGDVYGQSRT